MPGKDLMGTDHVAPVVDIILPTAHRSIYDQSALELHVQDDGEIDRIEFLIDGEESEDLGSQFLTPPYQTWWNCRELSLGKHFIQAIAYDKYGRIGFSPRVLFYKMSSDSLPPNDSIAYFESPEFDSNNEMSNDAILWRIPSETGKYTGFGTRFTLDKPGQLIKYGINIQFRDDLRDANLRWWGTQLKIEVLSSDNGLPGEVISTGEFDLNGLRNGVPFNGWVGLNLPVGNSRPGRIDVPAEFIISIELSPTAYGDTMSIATDLGVRRNWHGLVRENGEWRTFDAGPRVAFNPLIWAKVRYPEEQN